MRATFTRTVLNRTGDTRHVWLQTISPLPRRTPTPCLLEKGLVLRRLVVQAVLDLPDQAVVGGTVPALVLVVRNAVLTGVSTWDQRDGHGHGT